VKSLNHLSGGSWRREASKTSPEKQQAAWPDTLLITTPTIPKQAAWPDTLLIMSWALCCFSDGPVDGDPFPNGDSFQASLDRACCENPGCCLYGLACPCCASWHLRKNYLRNDMTQYTCCQSELPACCCFKPGEMSEQDCPNFCLCCESCCCTLQSVSSTRSATMRTYGLTSDPFDRRLIRCTNCLLCLSTVCLLCDCEGKELVTQCTNVVVAMTVGCMVAQVNHQLEYLQHATNEHGLAQGLKEPVVYGQLVDEGAPLIKKDMDRS
jgi:hypothetical protein